jgi:hypothetical protein
MSSWSPGSCPEVAPAWSPKAPANTLLRFERIALARCCSRRWAHPRLGWISMAEIGRAHRDAAKELNVE